MSGIARLYLRTLALLLALLASARADAQSSIPAPGPCDTGGSNNASCRMHLVFTILLRPARTLTVAPSPDFALAPASGTPSAADYDAGFFDAAGSIAVTVSSTAAWRVTVQSLAGQMSGACATRAPSTIQWGLTPGARTMALSTTPVTVASGATPTLNQRLDVFLRVSLDWLRDGPVSSTGCSLPVTFTISSP